MLIKTFQVRLTNL